MDLFYESIGSGPVLIFNHGWTMSHRLFERQRILSERFRVILWDLPGHGESEKRPEGYHLADCAAALHQLISQLHIESAVGLGWSLGSAVLWDYLRQYGEGPFTCIVNIESVPWGDAERFQVPATIRAFNQDRRRAARKFVRRMFYGNTDESIVEWIVQESLKTPTGIALPLYAELAACDYTSVTRQTKLPILSFMGRHGFYSDQVTAMETLMPTSHTHWFEQSGHMPFWQQAETFNEILTHWISPESL
jgi:non-heme chloroperoxidase